MENVYLLPDGETTTISVEVFFSFKMPHKVKNHLGNVTMRTVITTTTINIKIRPHIMILLMIL